MTRATAGARKAELEAEGWTAEVGRIVPADAQAAAKSVRRVRCLGSRARGTNSTVGVYQRWNDTGRGAMIRRILLAAVLALPPIVLASGPASAGGGGCTEVTSGGGGRVGLKGMCVYPTLIRLPSGGGSVKFTNFDAVDHVIVGSGLAWGSGGILHQFDSFTARFDLNGVYPFQCYIHPGMSGAVLVGDANGRGAATRTGVTLAGPSDLPLGSPAAATAAEDASDRGGWWALAVAALVLVVVLLVVRRPRTRSRAANTALPKPS
jgi:hypothetical protein